MQAPDLGGGRCLLTCLQNTTPFVLAALVEGRRSPTCLPHSLYLRRRATCWWLYPFTVKEVRCCYGDGSAIGAFVLPRGYAVSILDTDTRRFCFQTEGRAAPPA